MITTNRRPEKPDRKRGPRIKRNGREENKMSFNPFKFISIIAEGKELSDRDNAFRLEKAYYIIDTCLTIDTGKWETGIQILNKNWVIVEDYNDKDEAKEGHDKWVKLMEEDADRELPDIQTKYKGRN